MGDTLLADISNTVVGQEIGVFHSLAELRLATIGTNKSGRVIPLHHHIFEDGMWRQSGPAPQPIYRLTLKPCPEDHLAFGHRVHDMGKILTVQEFVVTDTGCQSTAIPRVDDQNGRRPKWKTNKMENEQMEDDQNGRPM